MPQLRTALPDPIVRASLGHRRQIGKDAERTALRAALNAARFFGLAAGDYLRGLRANDDPLLILKAKLDEAEIKAAAAWQCVDILRSRLAKIPERTRPYYTAAARFRILELRQLFGWSREDTAHNFLVCESTIANWDHAADPQAQTVGSNVKPTPPVVRIADVVRTTVQVMQRLGFGGHRMVARTLARAGWKLSARSVERIACEKPHPVPGPPAAPPRPNRPLKADFVHHVWMMDVSQVKAFLSTNAFYMATVFDAFSRVPLTLATFEHKPRASDMARLLKSAARAFGAPKYVVTDLGTEFTGKIFKRTARRIGIVQRFGCKANLYATARLESFWCTLKNTASLRLPIFLTRRRSRAKARARTVALRALPTPSRTPRLDTGRGPDRA